MCYYAKRINCINKKNKELIINEIYFLDENDEYINEDENEDNSYLHMFKVTISLFLYFLVIIIVTDNIFYFKI
tara:strand:- start:175 stop:393 length:219 start_codon:yes stop_codon:yes gene_type:complete